MIDINFDVYSDTPQGKDPDSYSPTLRKYHHTLWDKQLPNGKYFHLDLDTPKLLHHKSDLGEFFLSSDAITHTYHNVKKMSHIVDIAEAVDREEMDQFFSLCSTIGAYVIFPSKRVGNKMTINGARGVNHKIQDRFDLTLECIRRFYLEKSSPLSETFDRYTSFFNLFQDFKGYIDFFLLQDLVDEDYLIVDFWHPFVNFDELPLPKDLLEYSMYKERVIKFVNARNQRVLGYSHSL
jgi:hypothetical protein